jgi:hypothetical protein
VKDLAERTVAQSRDLLLAERLGDVRVDACFYYGAVEINPRHLVVWILLAGAPDSELPEWFTPEVITQRSRWIRHLSAGWNTFGRSSGINSRPHLGPTRAMSKFSSTASTECRTHGAGSTSSSR